MIAIDIQLSVVKLCGSKYEVCTIKRLNRHPLLAISHCLETCLETSLQEWSDNQTAREASEEITNHIILTYTPA